jgi:hypothetical protein
MKKVMKGGRHSECDFLGVACKYDKATSQNQGNYQRQTQSKTVESKCTLLGDLENLQIYEDIIINGNDDELIKIFTELQKIDPQAQLLTTETRATWSPPPPQVKTLNVVKKELELKLTALVNVVKEKLELKLKAVQAAQTTQVAKAAQTTQVAKAAQTTQSVAFQEAQAVAFQAAFQVAFQEAQAAQEQAQTAQAQAAKAQAATQSTINVKANSNSELMKSLLLLIKAKRDIINYNLLQDRIKNQKSIKDLIIENIKKLKTNLENKHKKKMENIDNYLSTQIKRKAPKYKYNDLENIFPRLTQGDKLKTYLNPPNLQKPQNSQNLNPPNLQKLPNPQQ